MTDAEIRSAVEICEGLYITNAYNGDTKESLAINKLLDLATREKEILPMTTDYRYGKVTQELLQAYNKGRTDTLLAVSKQLENLEDVVEETRCKGCMGYPTTTLKEVCTAIRESIRGEL